MTFTSFGIWAAMEDNSETPCLKWVKKLILLVSLIKCIRNEAMCLVVFWMTWISFVLHWQSFSKSMTFEATEKFHATTSCKSYEICRVLFSLMSSARYCTILSSVLWSSFSWKECTRPNNALNCFWAVFELVRVKQYYLYVGCSPSCAGCGNSSTGRFWLFQRQLIGPRRVKRGKVTLKTKTQHITRHSVQAWCSGCSYVLWFYWYRGICSFDRS